MRMLRQGWDLRTPSIPCKLFVGHSKDPDDLIGEVEEHVWDSKRGNSGTPLVSRSLIATPNEATIDCEP